MTIYTLKDGVDKKEEETGWGEIWEGDHQGGGGGYDEGEGGGGGRRVGRGEAGVDNGEAEEEKERAVDFSLENLIKIFTDDRLLKYTWQTQISVRYCRHRQRHQHGNPIWWKCFRFQFFLFHHFSIFLIYHLDWNKMFS